MFFGSVGPGPQRGLQAKKKKPFLQSSEITAVIIWASVNGNDNNGRRGEIMLKGEEMLFHLRQDWSVAVRRILECCRSLWLKVVKVKYGARCDSLERPSGSMFHSHVPFSRWCWLANLGCCSCSWLRLIDPFSSEKLSFFFCDHFIICMSPFWSFALDLFFH